MKLVLPQRVRTELRDLIELVLLPGLAAVLPWRWCFALFKALAHRPWLYRQACERALAEAKARVTIDDEARWLWTRRLITLVDHADLYLSATRSNAWLRQHVTVQGHNRVNPACCAPFIGVWACGLCAMPPCRA